MYQYHMFELQRGRYFVQSSMVQCILLFGKLHWGAVSLIQASQSCRSLQFLGVAGILLSQCQTQTTFMMSILDLISCMVF